MIVEERVNYLKFWVICSLHSLALAHIGTLFVRFIAQLDPFMLTIITFGWSDDVVEEDDPNTDGKVAFDKENQGLVGRCKDIYPVQ